MRFCHEEQSVGSFIDESKMEGEVALARAVSWLAAAWDDLPPIERSQLAGKD